MTRALLECCSNYSSLEKECAFHFNRVKSSEKDDRVSRWKTLRCIPGRVSWLHEYERSRIPTNISSFRSAVHTKFYGSARRRLLHRSFLFASGKYLTPYSGLFWQLPRLSLYLNRPRRALYTSFPPSALYVRGAWIFGSLFLGADRSNVTRSVSGRYFDQMSPYTRFPRWDDAKSATIASRIRDTDSSKPLRNAA